MKKISTTMFFTVLWKSLCQALGWFFGLFGYKRDGKFAKCVWGLFATSGAIILAIIALICLYGFGTTMYDKYNLRYGRCEDSECNANTYVGRNIYFHNHEDGRGYIFNTMTGERTIEDIAWIAEPMLDDSLVCFSDGKKRGYFSKNTGKVVIEPKYNHAWIFSEGLASVEEDGYIKFIDETGKVVIDNKLVYIPGMEGYVFHGGYCVVDTDNGRYCGLMDKTGKIVLPQEYDYIRVSCDLKYWRVCKDNKMAVLDNSLTTIIPLTECDLNISDGLIHMTMPDHTMRKYDMEGTLINDFYIADVRILEYEKEEILYQKGVIEDFTDVDDVKEYYGTEPYHPTATARLRAYEAGDGYEGLMTPDGHIVTMPLYKTIEAIGKDLYLCTVEGYDKLVVNGKGEIVK